MSCFISYSIEDMLDREEEQERLEEMRYKEYEEALDELIHGCTYQGDVVISPEEVYDSIYTELGSAFYDLVYEAQTSNGDKLSNLYKEHAEKLCTVMFLKGYWYTT